MPQVLKEVWKSVSRFRISSLIAVYRRLSTVKRARPQPFFFIWSMRPWSRGRIDQMPSIVRPPAADEADRPSVRRFVYVYVQNHDRITTEIRKRRRQINMPLFDELSRSSRDSFELNTDSYKSWDVWLNSSKSGMWFFFVFFASRARKCHDVFFFVLFDVEKSNVEDRLKRVLAEGYWLKVEFWGVNGRSKFRNKNRRISLKTCFFNVSKTCKN